MFVILVLVIFLPVCLSKLTEVTFKNVSFGQIDSLSVPTMRTVQFSNSLKDFLSPLTSLIGFSNQNIPIVYKGSLIDVHLTDLIFENCGINEIQPGSLTNASIIVLSIKGNNIQNIEEGVFNKVKVYRIELPSNRITTIHSNAFDDLPKLEFIDLSNNNIQRWNPQWFRNTPRLSIMEMQRNRISHLPSGAFRNLGRKYVMINLSQNVIETIESDEVFDGAGDGMMSDLSRNPLSCESLNKIRNGVKKNKKTCIVSPQLVRKCSV